MKNQYLTGGIVMIMCTLFLPAYSADITASSGILLKKNSGVRAEGMGGAQTAVPTDEAGALSWNPAGVYGDRSQNASATYFHGVADDSFGSIHFNLPYGEDWVMGGALGFFDAGSMELNQAEETTTVSAQRDFLAAFTGAYRYGIQNHDVAAGANVKFLQSTLLGKYSAFTMAVDLGARLDWNEWPVHAGLAFRNLGMPIKYSESADSLPSYALAGLAWDAYQDSTFKLLLAGDLQYDLAAALRGNLGTEVRLLDLFSVRAGYKLGYDVAGMTVGFGLNYENLQFDYAFSPVQNLSPVHSASIKYIFDVLAPKAGPAAAQPAEPDYMPVNVEPVQVGPSKRVQVPVMEIRKMGGMADKVVLGVGSQQGITTGIRGSLFNAAGELQASFRIVQVDPQLSLAEIIGMSKEIDRKAIAVLDVPVTQ